MKYQKEISIMKRTIPMLVLFFFLPIVPLRLALTQELERGYTDFPVNNEESIDSYENDTVYDLNELGPPIKPNDVQRGSLLFRNKESRYVQAPTLKTDVQFFIVGMIVRAEVRQYFHNPTDEWLEGVYVFPLPESAAVDHLRMVIGEKVIEGEIRERGEARQIYEDAKDKGKKASLLTQERPNIFTTSVANIAPHEEIEIIIHFQHNATYNGKVFTIRFPLVIAPRFIPQNTIVDGVNGTGWALNTDCVPDAARITPPVLDQNSSRNQISILVDLEAGFPVDVIRSVYHEIIIEPYEDDLFRISLKDNQIAADRDFVLEWEPHRGEKPQAALFTQDTRQGIYSLLMIMPPSPEEFIDIRLPRECIFVIDTSGSMLGNSIQQAKQALLYGLDRLRYDDSFNIIQFNSYAEKMFKQSKSPNLENLNKARCYINELQAKGGTHIHAALEEACRDTGSAHRMRQIIFITDGAVGNEDQLFSYIEKNLGRSRLFTVGIGSAPNTHFMHRAAIFVKGTFTYIGKNSEVAEKMSELFEKIENPVLADIEMIWNDPDVEYYPAILPDLYLGEPVVVCAKLFHVKGDIKIRGHCNGYPWNVRFTLSRGQEHESISKLWARQKIDDILTRSIRAADKKNQRQEIIDIALEHHLVSKYTSLVAIDKTPAKPVDEHLNKVAVPVNMPQGWSMTGSIGQLPQTGTRSILLIVLGLICILSALTLRWTLRNV